MQLVSRGCTCIVCVACGLVTVVMHGGVPHYNINIACVYLLMSVPGALPTHFFPWPSCENVQMKEKFQTLGNHQLVEKQKILENSPCRYINYTSERRERHSWAPALTDTQSHTVPFGVFLWFIPPQTGPDFRKNTFPKFFDGLLHSKIPLLHFQIQGQEIGYPIDRLLWVLANKPQPNDDAQSSPDALCWGKF